MENKKHFHTNIKWLRYENRMTQTDLANKLNCGGASTVSKWETIGVIPPAETLDALSRLFKVSIDDLLNKDLSKPEVGSALRDLQAFEEHTDPGLTIGARAQAAAKEARRIQILQEIERDTIPPDEWMHKPTPTVVPKSQKTLEPIQAYQLTDREARLIAYFRLLNPDAQEALLTMARSSAGGTE